MKQSKTVEAAIKAKSAGYKYMYTVVIKRFCNNGGDK